MTDLKRYLTTLKENRRTLKAREANGNCSRICSISLSVNAIDHHNPFTSIERVATAQNSIKIWTVINTFARF
jgi:hypothetical protein